jgi:glucose/arabinose dehydrogenase
VTDGHLDVDPAGGTNTKIDYITIATASAQGPHVTDVTPVNGATGVCTDGAVTVQLSGGVDPTTATAAGLQLLTPAGTQVAGFYNTDGAYSNVTFVPSANLAPNTTYTIKTNGALRDPQGGAYAPFASTFTTGAAACTPQADVSFHVSTFDAKDGSSGGYSTTGPSALALGPNPNSPTQLWAAFGNGNILVYTLNPATGQAVGAPTQVQAFKGQRVVSGLLFDPSSTAGNIKLWVSNGQFGCDLAAIGVACNDFTGAISTLTGPTAGTLAKTNIVTGLPRSVGNHMNNGIAFGPDGALYLAQGAENGYGSPDAIWGNRSEDPLSAAVLRIDVAGIGANVPYSVNTSTGYNPNAANARVKTYATGTRNPYSLVWHSNGKLYAPVNESANGNTPADPGGGAPALNDLPSYDDYFTRVVAGRYYGHPNPARGEYRLNGGNPTAQTDPFEVPQYPVGTQPNANWRKPDMDLGLHRSADGAAEFTSNVFGSNLRSQILVTEYSQGKDIIAIKLDANGNAVSKSVVASGFYNPLPIAIDNATGRVYVGEYGRDPDGVGGQLTLLTP